MARPVDPGRIELLDDTVAAALRRKSPAERLALGFEANRMARLVIEGPLRSRHPDWSDRRIEREVARRMLGTS